MNKLKYIIPTILSITIGLYLGKLIYTNYQNNINVQNVFNESNNVYFLQQGVYSTKESMNNNTTILSDYIYVLEDSMYKVYVGITTNQDVANIIKTIYSDKNINIYVKQLTISDPAFVTKLKEYDKLIIDNNDSNEILNVEKQVMSEYEVLMKNE